MRGLWTAVRFVGRWLGPVLIAVAALLLIFPPSPFFDASALPALAGAILSTTGRLVSRGPERKRIRILLGTCALAGLAFFGWRQWEGGRGYRAETVSFDNRGARLAGTLYLPDRPGKVPGIVWVHGSGPQTRGSNEPFAIHFARSGYAVLMFDKRGVGESTGRYEWDRNVSPENIDLLASDASAALSLLARHPEVRSDSVGFVGISQAGWITPRAAVLNGRAAFMLLLSGPATSTHALIRYERFHIGAPGSSPGVSMAIKAWGQGDIPDGMSPDEADVIAQKRPIDLPFADYDPAADLRALDVPGLWLLGDRDWMVPSGPTARRLDELRRLGKPYQYRHIPGAIHGMIVAPKAIVLEAIDGWLAKVTRRGS